MKLYHKKHFTLFCFLFSSSYANEFDIECKKDDLVISVPLNNENIANILELHAGNCTHENIPNGLKNTISYSDGSAKLAIPTSKCNLKGIYSISKLDTREGELGKFYMPTVNFSLGEQLEDGTKILFQQFEIVAECGLQTVYNLEVDYEVENRQEQPECQMVNGVCIFFEHSQDAVFKIVETNSNYTQNLTFHDHEANRKQPGEPIFIKVVAEFVPEGYDWAITKCFNTDFDTNITVPLINPAEDDGVCSWDGVNLVAEYASKDEFRISHSVFLIGNPRKINNKMTCQIEICENNDFDSVCKKAGRVCGKYPPVCESEQTIDTRIVGGSSDLEQNLPFQSMTEWILYISMGCGASWIDQNTILTAAHCFDFENDENTGYRLNKVVPNKVYQLSKYSKNDDQNDKEFLASFLGSQVVIHPGYDDVTKVHDVAIINLYQVEKKYDLKNQKYF